MIHKLPPKNIACECSLNTQSIKSLKQVLKLFKSNRKMAHEYLSELDPETNFFNAFGLNS